MNANGQTLTFYQLIQRYEKVQIPILQRDYAQGRKETKFVRELFLDSIKETLTSIDNKKSQLGLDFIYGSSLPNENNIFSVLDGQQRLTTLFLLHWYFAHKENKFLIFKSYFSNNGYSKFNYMTRISANEFFDALISDESYSIDFTNDSLKISDQIIDKPWFYLSWKLDPTVSSCLNMLDAIHEKFSNIIDNFFDALLDEKKPKITFQYLKLQSFGLSDELYIKMNARGKALTDFENFKSWFTKHLKEKIELNKEIEFKIDQQWMDLFWNVSKRNDVKNANKNLDQIYLRFFNLMAFYSTCEKQDRNYDQINQNIIEYLRILRTSFTYFPVANFIYLDCFNEKTITRISLILDYFTNHVDNNEILNILTNSLLTDDYLHLAKFYAFIKKIEFSNITKNLEQKSYKWDRVTSNFLNNYRLEELDHFISTLLTIDDLSLKVDELYKFLSEKKLKIGFTTIQREEESIKASLILKNNDWDNIIRKAENHSYLQGKIISILELSKDENGYCIEKFKSLVPIFHELLSEKILEDRNYILQRSLLTLGDYMPQKNNRIFSLGIPQRTRFRDRSENWLEIINTFAFTELIKILLNAKKDIPSILNDLINKHQVNDWRKYFIENITVYKYCSKKLIFRENEQVYLLSKTNFRGYHAELRTFCLAEKLNKMQEEKKLSKEIINFTYVEVYGTDMPYLNITYGQEQNDFYISYLDSKYEIISEHNLEIPSIIKSYIE
ncbi:DUF262 domain-containing protein [Acinetobacter bereziniae]|uniref:DUF262 domain-containing protein n=1 Tax=Acinetobacter bereziniae TaxID=106648 RepID=UPI0021D30368|nr:DUF262 domain-containing protein [Acinetobacter bereziniae]MCU4598480.1 DUF262 domain-containing protein [Acinetobacter bereziniae]